MARRASSLIGILVLAALTALGSISVARAESQRQPELAGSPVDLVNAVNVLRASYGLAPYSIDATLMYTAQSQADFLAATESMTHSGPNGISVTDRLLAAGYPLAGDLSLGGFRSENITRGAENMTVQSAVNSWTSDSLHLTTMISSILTEIGAGVAVNNGRVYYVIDCALPTTSGMSSAAATSVEGGSTVPAAAAVIMPVTLSTPNADGDLIHEVKAGQSLWSIAIAYKVKIDDIRSLNGLAGNDIYPGNKLLIKKGVLVPTTFLTETPVQTPTSTVTNTPVPIPSRVSVTWAPTPTLVSSSVSTNNSRIMKIAMGIIALALLGGGIFGWLGGSRKK